MCIEREYISIDKLLFPGVNPDLKKVEEYIQENIGRQYEVKITGDVINIGSKFSSEYCGSVYTKKLRGAMLKAKANAVQELPQMIISAENRRWIENKDKKHSKDAKGGWYRYDTRFMIPVFDNEGKKKADNCYLATLVARINDNGIYLHDMVNIKKEASKPFESN